MVIRSDVVQSGGTTVPLEANTSVVTATGLHVAS